MTNFDIDELELYLIEFINSFNLRCCVYGHCGIYDAFDGALALQYSLCCRYKIHLHFI